MMAKILSLLLLLMIGAPALAGEAVRIQLKWYHQFQFAGYYAALEKGFFAEEGLDVELLERDPSKNNILQVYEGEAEYGVADSVLLLYQTSGLGLRIVAPIFQQSPSVLMTLASSGIETPQDLVGRRIRLYDNETDGFPLLAFLAEQGVLERGFTRQAFNPDFELLIRGDSDAMHGYAGNEPYRLRELGHEVRLFHPAHYGIDLYGDMLFTTEREAEQHPERIAAMRRAVLKGWEYALDHKEEIARLILEQYSRRKSFAALMYEAQATEQAVARFSVPLGTLDPGRLRYIQALYQRHGLLDKQLTIETRSFFLDEEQAGIPLTEDEQAFLRAHPVIRVGIDPDWYPLEFVDENGRFGGISADYLALLEARLGIRFEPVTDQSWSRAMELVRTRELDMLSMAAQTPERSAYALFTEPYIHSPMVIVTNDQVDYIGDPARLLGHEVAVVQGYAPQEWLKTHQPRLRLRPVDSTRQGLEQVATGEIFALVDNLAAVSFLIKQQGFSNLKISGQLPLAFDLAMAARSDWPLLRSILQKGLDAISQDEKHAIYDKWIRLQYETRLDLKRIAPYFLVLLGILLVVTFDALRFRRLHLRLKLSNQQLKAAEEQLINQNRELKRLSITDTLTGACNRLKLDAVLGELQARAQRYGGGVSIILFDLDHFKQVNDRHGHPVGDEVLRRFADLVRRTIRETDVFGRWGGEEFMLACPETGLAEAVQLAERIRQAFATLELPSGRQTLSAGVAEWRTGQSVETWIDLCDQRLYQAKSQGRNRVIGV
ncbi:ABC transporter substrate-binding protein [Allochromatium palmeri]|uniref:diguanylate cyclase n=1 Tax=Allochromatium palmeri TaxID=231048 RepID=A0A6N8EAR2_9GAMM|nr:ABC transporter substrate-binding protein [Allochromatium palmeri]MTW20418.1 diguanylate cyclase [Allochromatium palmeri]